MMPTTELSPSEIRKEEWLKPPAKNRNVLWVFMHVDVIGHSRLFQKNMSGSELRDSHNVLKNFREQVVWASIPDYDPEMEWDWAGDGGIFAFRADDIDLHTTEKVVLVAEEIRNKLRQSNEQQSEAKYRLEVRIVLASGPAYYYPDKELRTGSALNIAGKLRIPGERTSIVVTDSVFRDLQKSFKVQFRPVEPVDTVDEPVYVYVPALRDALQESLDQEAQDGDPMQAAHLAYRLGVLVYGMGDSASASVNFKRAESLLRAEEKHQHRYYHRTLRAFYRLWARLADATTAEMIAPLVAGGESIDRRLFLRRLETIEPLKHALHTRWQFLHEMEFCIEQLDILARHPVADPTGLTTMQICLLLERFGYPRRWHGNAIAKRIKRIKTELHETEEDADPGTMDKGCSLCTAVAASCLILENDEDPNVKHMMLWLASKKSQRFSTRSESSSRAPEDAHALHYAASVLQSLVDYKNSNHAAVRDVVDVFFTASIHSDDLPKHWIRHLRIPYYDLACYIFSAFARTIIASTDPHVVGLTKVRQESLRNALAGFGRRLLAEAAAAEAEPERIYAARENLGSLALGLLVGFPDDMDIVLMFERLRDLIYKVAFEDGLDRPERRKTTIDSNFDRLWRMLDGWLLQWECALVARERGLPIRPELAHVFPDV